MDLTNRHVHFVGIGGIGMSALAQIVQERGARVSGCDLRFNRMTRHLEERQIPVLLGHDASHLEGVDIVVYSSAIPPHNPELLRAEVLGLSIYTRQHMLATMMEGKRAVGVAGAHGKTTTTWMCSNLLIEAGMDPTVMVGGVVPTLKNNFRQGHSDWFVAEVDESDRLLLELTPTYAVLLNIDKEHLDRYKDADDVERVFAEYLRNTKPEGVVIGCVDDVRVRRLLSGCNRRAIGFSVQGEADVFARAEQVIYRGDGARYDVWAFGKRMPDVSIAMPGIHNVSNSLAAVALGHALGLSEDVIRRSLLTCPRVKRRFEIKWEQDGVRLVDDYGHHPTEIAATLRAARRVAEGRLICVFQPHRYTRTAGLMEEFSQAFAGTDHLVIMEIYSAQEPPMEGVTGAALAERIRRAGHPRVEFVARRDLVLEHLASVMRPGDTILTVGAGDIGSLGDELFERLWGLRKAG